MEHKGNNKFIITLDESTDPGSSTDPGTDRGSVSVELPEVKVHVCQDPEPFSGLNKSRREKELRLLGLKKDDFALFHSQPKAYKVLGVFDEEKKLEQHVPKRPPVAKRARTRTSKRNRLLGVEKRHLSVFQDKPKAYKVLGLFDDRESTLTPADIRMLKRQENDLKRKEPSCLDFGPVVKSWRSRRRVGRHRVGRRFLRRGKQRLLSEEEEDDEYTWEGRIEPVEVKDKRSTVLGVSQSELAMFEKQPKAYKQLAPWAPHETPRLREGDVKLIEFQRRLRRRSHHLGSLRVSLVYDRDRKSVV